MNSDWTFCVAPMMDWTDPFCRQFHRLLSEKARLYTEMVTTGAIIHGDRDRHLAFEPVEHPVALQLGGFEPAALAVAAKAGEDYGYDEINLNCGCPSDRVQNGAFGACLMAQPERVADCVESMRNAVSIPVTVKCRLGIDDLDSDEHLHRFIGTVASAGCEVFIIHARKAWLKGLSPKQNREIPPLQYERVNALKAAFPDLSLVLNGGLGNLPIIEQKLNDPTLAGVMVGRAAYQDPWLLSRVDLLCNGVSFADKPDSFPVDEDRDAVVESLKSMVAGLESQGQPARRLIRHILGLYNGQPGAKLWRRRLSQPLASGEGVSALSEALDLVQNARRTAHDRTHSPRTFTPDFEHHG